jgi:esterase/lipase superfamily enzyme
VRARHSIGPVGLLLFVLLLCVCVRDEARALDRWPPWQSYGEAESAARAKQKRRAPQQNEIDALNRQVEVLRQAGKYAEAVPVAQRALKLTEQRHGPNHAATAAALTTLAELLIAQNRYADAEPLLKRALAIREKSTPPPDDDNVAQALDNLAKLYEKQGRTADAEPLLKRSAALREKAQGTPSAEAGPPPAAAAPSAPQPEGAAKTGEPSGEQPAAGGGAPDDETKRAIEELDRPLPPKTRALARKAPPPAAARDGGAPPAAANGEPAPELEKAEPQARGAGAPPPAVPPPPAAAVKRNGGAPAAMPPPTTAEDKSVSRSGGGRAPEDAARAPEPMAPPPIAAAPAEAPPEPLPTMAPPPPPPPPTMAPEAVAPAAEEQKEWDVVPVFYGTDREVEPNAKRLSFGSDRGRRLQLGRALVTVPKAHEVPQIERPWAIHIPYFDVKIYEQPEDPKKHFTMQEIKQLSKEDFLKLVRERLAGSGRFKDHALVFVHGYNTAFDNAVYRTAQISYDLKFDGVPFLYSWPSGGGVASYTYDRESAEASKPYMRKFLDMVVKETGAKTVSIIAHSMGNQPLLDVLKDMKSSAPEGVVISQVILAAPDVDADTFADLAQAIKGLAKGVTLYAAANDRALLVSRQFWGNYRAGDVPAGGPLVLPGIDTIDVTAASMDAFAINHSGYAQNNELLKDIGELIETGVRPPDQRILKPELVTTQKGAYWRYAAHPPR